MGNINDTKIIELKKQIKEKRDKLDSTKKFSPVTNCSIEVDGVRHNIQVLQKNQIITLMVKLNAYKISAEELELLDDYIISGYKVEDWITDLKTRLELVSRKDMKKEN